MSRVWHECPECGLEAVASPYDDITIFSCDDCGCEFEVLLNIINSEPRIIKNGIWYNE